MYKLVVFSALLAVAAASGVIHSSPAVAYASAPLVHNWPSTAHIATPVVNTYSAPAVAVGHAITKHVHYASQPVVTGYTSQILKPNLGALATPLHSVTQQRVLAPARTVATITPQITQVQPELHVRKVPVDVPVAQPVIAAAPAQIVESHSVVSAGHAIAAAPAQIVESHSVVSAGPAIAAAPAQIVEARYAHAAPAQIVEARYAHAGPLAIGHNIISSPYIGSQYAVPALSHNVW